MGMGILRKIARGMREHHQDDPREAIEKISADREDESVSEPGMDPF